MAEKDPFLADSQAIVVDENFEAPNTGVNDFDNGEDDEDGDDATDFIPAEEAKEETTNTEKEAVAETTDKEDVAKDVFLNKDKEVTSDAAPEEVATTTTETESELRAKLLKEMGFDNEDEAKAYKESKSKVELTEQEKEAIAIQEEAEINKVAVSNGLSRGEIEMLKLAESKTAQEIVLDNYLKENQSRLSEDLLEEDLIDEFNEIYAIESDNDLLKAKGEKLLELEKKEILGDKLNILNKSKEQYESNKKFGALSKKYDSIITDTVSSFGDSFTYKLEGEDITIPVKEFDFTALEKEMRENPALLDLFATNQEGFADTVKNLVKDSVENHKENKERLVKEAYDLGWAKAIKQNAVGAHAPFQGNTATKQESGEVSSNLARTAALLRQ